MPKRPADSIDALPSSSNPIGDALAAFTRTSVFAQAQQGNPHWQYVPSRTRTRRFRLRDGHRYLPPAAPPTGINTPNLGPVELDILSFITADDHHVAVRIGGMGTGKTTTVRHLTGLLPTDSIVLHLDFNSNLYEDHAPNSSAGAFVEHLAQLLQSEMDKRIAPSEEIETLWTWALDPQLDTGEHPSALVLARARQLLRIRHEGTWREMSPSHLETRRQALEALCRTDDPTARLQYQLLRIDYFLSTTLQGARHRFLEHRSV